MAGRPRTPSNLLELKGAYKRNPNRRHHAEPVPTKKIGLPPRTFDKAHKKIWRELVRCFELASLGNSDRLALEVLCCLTHEFRKDPESFQAAKHGRMSSLIGLFGGMPAMRSKIQVKKKPQANAFADF
jgi:phage terminase small subunit